MQSDFLSSEKRAFRTGKFPFTGSGSANDMEQIDGFVKIIGDKETGEILGVHILGEHATDLIGDVVTAMTMESVVEDLAVAVKPHPTLSKTIMEAAMDWCGIPIHKNKKKWLKSKAFMISGLRNCIWTILRKPESEKARKYI